MTVESKSNGHTIPSGVQTPAKCLPPEYYTDFLSAVAKMRKPSPIRVLFPLEKTPGVISLLAGKPNDAMFPFSSFQFGSHDPSDPSKSLHLSVDEDILRQGLQYGPTSGIEPCVEWITVLQEREHGRNRSEGWRLSITNGSQDALYKAIHATVDPGDSVLVEKPVYAGVIPLLDSLNAVMIDVEADSHGIKSSSLRVILETWPTSKPKPKVLYTVPYGCNPTGVSTTLERKLEILQLARKHHFLIFEDDPYYYLYYGDGPRIPSYFTLEARTGEVGHVLRFDSFSKVFSAGIRFGFATGPTVLLNAIDMHTATSNLQASSFVQSIVVTLLQTWGFDGFAAHTRNVAQFYRARRDVFEAALRRHLDGLAEWTSPEAGMFFWFKILFPDGKEGDSFELISTKAYAGGVVALPGTSFFANGDKTAFVRASFSLLEEAEIDEALRRLRVVILKEHAGQ